MIALMLRNVTRTVDVYNLFKNMRLKKLKAAVASSHVKGQTRKYLENELEAEHFKLSTGIYLERAFRERVIEIYQLAHGELSLLCFRQALPYMQYDNENKEVLIKITASDRITCWLSWVPFWGIMLPGLYFLVLASGIIVRITITQRLIYSCGGVVIIAMAMALAFILLSPISCAKRIDRFIQNRNRFKNSPS